MTFNTFKIIILSRIRKTKESEQVKDRRNICLSCQYNTKNQTKLSLRVRVVKFFSDLYSLVTGNIKKDILGNCSAPGCGCSIYFKTSEPEENCPINKWKK